MHYILVFFIQVFIDFLEGNMDNKIQHHNYSDNTGLQKFIVTSWVIKKNEQMNINNNKGIVPAISQDLNLVFLNCYFDICLKLWSKPIVFDTIFSIKHRFINSNFNHCIHPLFVFWGFHCLRMILPAVTRHTIITENTHCNRDLSPNKQSWGVRGIVEPNQQLITSTTRFIFQFLIKLLPNCLPKTL